MEAPESSAPGLRRRTLAILDDDNDKDGQQRSAFDDDAAHGSLTLLDLIPDAPLLQQIPIHDRLWSSYTSIYDSEDEDFLPRPLANGYERTAATSVEEMERLNFSLIDFSTTLDKSFQSLLPYSDEDEDTSSSDSSGSSHALSRETEELRESNLEDGVSQRAESTFLNKLDKKVFGPRGTSNLSGNDGESSLSSRLKSNAISTTAIYRMKRRIRSRRRRQITILRAAIVHKKALQEAASNAREIDADNSIDASSHTPNEETSDGDGELGEEKNDELQRVSISTLSKKVGAISLKSNSVESTEGIVPKTMQEDEDAISNVEEDDEDNNTVVTSNQRHDAGDGYDSPEVLQIQNTSMPLSTEMSLASSLRSGRTVMSERKQRQSQRSSSPSFYRLPRRLTPSPTRMGRNSRSHQKTSFGKYFPLSRSLPSSPTIEMGKKKLRIQRVQFIGLSRPPSLGPMPVDRWLSMDDEKKKQSSVSMLDTTQHSSLVSSVSADTRAVPPMRKQSIESFESDRSWSKQIVLAPTLQRCSSLASDVAAAAPTRKNSDDGSLIEKREASSSKLSLVVSVSSDVEEDIASIEDGSIVKPLQEVNPLLAAVLTRLSSVAATVFPGASRAPLHEEDIDDSVELRQNVGEDSKQQMSVKRNAQLNDSVALPIRIDSLGSDQSSLDLLPYKPPIPEASGAIEEFFSNSKVPKDVGILSDAGSVSTHSVSTRTGERCSLRSGRRIHDLETIFSVEDKIGSPIATRKQREVLANSPLSPDTRVGSGLPPSGRSFNSSPRGRNRGSSRDKHSKPSKVQISSKKLKQRSKSRDDRTLVDTKRLKSDRPPRSQSASPRQKDRGKRLLSKAALISSIDSRSGNRIHHQPRSTLPERTDSIGVSSTASATSCNNSTPKSKPKSRRSRSKSKSRSQSSRTSSASRSPSRSSQNSKSNSRRGRRSSREANRSREGSFTKVA